MARLGIARQSIAVLGLLLVASMGFRPHTAAARQSSESYLVVVVGIGGEQQYREAFFAWGKAIVDAAIARHGVPADNIRFFTEQPDMAPDLADGVSNKENVQAALMDLASRTGPEDQVTIILIGHGTFQPGASSFNLSGPDMTATEFQLLLNPIRARVAFANTTNASGEFVGALSGANRIILTATKSGQERNAAVFGRYFAEAFSGDGADTDKDNRVSILEAFEYARLQVAREYEDDNRLLTEHAILDDNGDGVGASEPGTEAEDGSIAAAMFLATGAAAAGLPADASPALRALYDRKAVVERQIADLRARRNQMEQEEYDRQLEALLLELARVNQEIRAQGGGGGG